MSGTRQALLAKIHIARKDLHLTDDDYRALLQGTCGVESAAQLTERQGQQLLARLADLGWQPRRKGRPRNLPAAGKTSRQPSRAAQLAKIEALLTIGGKPWAYADALALRICQVDKVAWVKSGDLYKIITALRKQALREGWDLQD